MFQLRQISDWWSNSQEGSDWSPLETVFLFSFNHTASHHSWGCSWESRKKDSSCGAGGGADWLFRCTLDIFGTVYTFVTIMRGAGFICNFSLTHLLLLRFLYEGCVYVTWTDSGEMNSSEKWEWLWKNWKRARANATIWAWRELHRWVCVWMCVSLWMDCSHECQVGFCGRIYQAVAYFQCACLPGVYQASISNAALCCVIDVHQDSL